jgi:RNA polymerase sigma factor (sigma-70 family)
MGLLDRESVARLWKQHGAALVLYARQLCDTPEDVVQDAFMMLTEKARDIDNPVGWIYRVVRNRALNVTRSSGRQSRREATVATQRDHWFDPAPGDAMDAAEMTAALKQLPTDQREVIVARVWGGLSFEEIARLRGMPSTSTFRCYQRGLTALRERLGVLCVTKHPIQEN